MRTVRRQCQNPYSKYNHQHAVSGVWSQHVCPATDKTSSWSKNKTYDCEGHLHWELPVSMAPGSIIFLASASAADVFICFQCISAVDFLYHSHPVIKRFRFHSTLATLVFSKHCIRSTASTASKKPSKIFLLSHHTMRQPPLVWCHGCCGPARPQTPKMLRRCVKTAAITICILKCRLAWQKPEKGHLITRKKSPSSTNFNVYQYSLQKLMSLAPSKKKKGGNSHHSLSHHSIPPHHGITTPQKAPPCTEPSCLHHTRLPWSPMAQLSWHHRQGGAVEGPIYKLIVSLLSAQEHQCISIFIQYLR